MIVQSLTQKYNQSDQNVHSGRNKYVKS